MSKVNDHREKTPDRWGQFFLLSIIYVYYALGVRAADLMLVKSDSLSEKAKENSHVIKSTLGIPGRIFDRNDLPLTNQELVFAAYINLKNFRLWAGKNIKYRDKKKERVIAQIADIFDIDELKFRDELDSDRDEMVLKKGLLTHEKREIEKDDLPEVFFRGAYKTFYLGQEATSHVVGFVNSEGQGQGVVHAKDVEISTTSNGERKLHRTRKGGFIQDLGEIPAQDGKDQYLTIDTRLQFLASEVLERAVEKKHKASSGSVVIIDVENGEILAMVNYPFYNPNALDNKVLYRRNHVIQHSYEPGSTMKPIVAAIAIEEGLVRPSTVLPTTKPVDGIRPTKDWDLSVSEIIMYSENLGAILLAKMIDDARLENGYRQFGFGADKKLLGLAGEDTGWLPDHRNWHGLDKGRLGFGYGMKATLLQLARAYAVFARGGTLPGIKLLLDEPQASPVRVISTRTANSIMEMLELATSEEGTGSQVGLFGYRIAGKTGTTAVYDEKKKYDSGLFRASFVALVPAVKPKFVCAAMVQKPTDGGYYGGQAAAPVCRKILSAALRLYAVPPDAMLAESRSDGES